MPASSQSSTAVDHRLFLAYLALLAWIPIPLGSNRPWSSSLMVVWCLALALWWGMIHWREAPHASAAWKTSLPARWLFGLWLGLLLLQLLPLPAGMVRWLSPSAAELHTLIRPDARWLTLSVDPHATLAFLLRSCALFLLFALTLALLNSYHRVQLLIRLAIGCGVLQALIGGVTAMSTLDNASGTFVNRNHFAGFLEICLALGTGLLMGNLGRGEGGSLRQRTRAVIRWLVSPKMSLRILLAIMVIGLILSRSRMGNFAFFSSLLITGAIWLLLARHRSRRIGVLILVSIVLIDVYLLGQWFGVEKVVERIQQTRLETENRDEVSLETVDYWRDYLWTGSGGGSFYSIFPRYRGNETTEGYFLHAHNDYLELLVDTGAPGLGLLGGMVLLSLWQALKAMRTRRQHIQRGLAFGVVMGIIALLMHSSVDFNLQIPAVSAWFVVLLALGWIALALREPSSNSRPSSRRSRHSRRTSR